MIAGCAYACYACKKEGANVTLSLRKNLVGTKLQRRRNRRMKVNRIIHKVEEVLDCSFYSVWQRFRRSLPAIARL